MSIHRSLPALFDFSGLLQNDEQDRDEGTGYGRRYARGRGVSGGRGRSARTAALWFSASDVGCCFRLRFR
jgi:hypothetical protein